jgi:hypothetical protein
MVGSALLYLERVRDVVTKLTCSFWCQRCPSPAQVLELNLGPYPQQQLQLEGWNWKKMNLKRVEAEV